MALRFYEPKLNQEKVCKAEDIDAVQKRRQHYSLYQRNKDNCNEIDEGVFYDVKDDDFLTIFQPVEDERAILFLCFKEVFNAMSATIDAWGGFLIANPALTRF